MQQIINTPSTVILEFPHLKQNFLQTAPYLMLFHE